MEGGGVFQSDVDIGGSNETRISGKKEDLHAPQRPASLGRAAKRTIMHRGGLAHTTFGVVGPFGWFMPGTPVNGAIRYRLLSR